MIDVQIMLDQYLIQWYGRKFKYGSVDCVQFVVKWLLYRHPHKKFTIPKYRAKFQADKILCQFQDLETAVSKQLGPPKSPLQVHRGDIVLCKQGDVLGLGICTGTHIAVLSNHSVGFLPLENGVKAWNG